jgi:uncharacterized protein (DUF2147 family)
MKKLLLGLALFGSMTASWAQTTPATPASQMTPVGLWRTVDDQTGEALAEIRITAKANGSLGGVVERALEAGGNEGKEPNCTACTDDRKDKPKIGMEIIRDARQTEGKTVWETGTILDPENGKTYGLRMTPLEGGKKLQVRGYLGPFWRTQVWLRVQ